MGKEGIMRGDSLDNTGGSCSVYYLIPNPYQFFLAAFVPSCLFHLCLIDFLYLSWTKVPLRRSANAWRISSSVFMTKGP